ncbi:DUF4440 domain-containing protein [Marinifilum fragile]|uniref:YybH family protein n=1 Tax=Marinifilum fragile TaxID=570161 RepID=UPI002AA67CDD|nr:DUF4440 domain-containing protein [Marinifilum fragile]
MKMSVGKVLYLLLIGVSITACNPKVDVEVCKQEILQVDEEFSDFSVKHGMKKAFYVFADDSAVMLRENSYPIMGKEAIKQLFSNTNDSGFSLSWKPSFAEVAHSGDLGYTYGIYHYTTPDTITKGTYVSIWKKGLDGKWKYVLDSGNQGLGEE